MTTENRANKAGIVDFGANWRDSLNLAYIKSCLQAKKILRVTLISSYNLLWLKVCRLLKLTNVFAFTTTLAHT